MISVSIFLQIVHLNVSYPVSLELLNVSAVF